MNSIDDEWSRYLNGDDNICGTSQLIDENGCFNKFPNRVEKCNRIRNHLQNYQEVLDNWTDFQEECRT